MVGTDTAKDHIYSRLRLTEPGPRFIHYPIGHGFDEEFYGQLCSEKRLSRFVKGKEVGQYVKTRSRNEALDLEVYNMPALDMLNVRWDALVNRLAKRSKQDDKGGGSSSAQRPVTRSGFVNSWRK